MFVASKPARGYEMSTPLLQVENLKKYFEVPAGYLHAVDDVSFTVNRGETMGVVGESGCGKSTLGRVVLHLLDSTDGKILFDGEDVTHVSPAKQKELSGRMQIIFQDPFSSLNPRMTVSQTISEAMLIAGQLSRADIQKRVFELMDTVGLAGRFVNTYPHELDGGRRQRIGIARALYGDPELLVLDEATSALDNETEGKIMDEIYRLSEGRTLVVVAHRLSTVERCGKRIVIEKGRVAGVKTHNENTGTGGKGT